MALRVWLPLNGSLVNQGLSNFNITVSSGTLTYENGKTGKGIDTAAQVLYFTDSNLNGCKNFTLCFWLISKSSSTVTSDWNQMVQLGTKCADGTNGSNFRFESTYTYSPRGCSWHNNSTYSIANGSRTLIQNKDEWHHVCVVYNGVKLYQYVDGQLLYTDTGLGGSLTGYVVLGKVTNSPGTLCDFRIYDECLSGKQIKDISKGLCVHYTLDDPYIESTTNLIEGYEYKTGTSEGWGAHRGNITDVTLSGGPTPFKNASKMIVTYDTSVGTGGGVGIQTKKGYVTLSASTQYYYSTYVKPTDSFDTYFNANFLYRYEYDDSGTKTTEGGCASKANSEYCGDGWYRIWGTFTTKSTTTKGTFFFFTYPYKSTTYYLGGCQLEQKDHLTPYTNKIRTTSIQNDVSGFGNVLSLVGTQKSITEAKRGTYSSFLDGMCSQYLRRNSLLFLQPPFTFSIWTYQTATTVQHGTGTTTRQFIFSQGRDCGYGGFSLYSEYNSTSKIYEARLLVGTETSGTNSVIYSGVDILDGWHLLTGTHDGTTAKLYIDGVLKSSATATSTLNWTEASGNLVIGKMAYGATSQTTYYFPFGGYVNDARVYATALSADEIKNLYEVSSFTDEKGKAYIYELFEPINESTCKIDSQGRLTNYNDTDILDVYNHQAANGKMSYSGGTSWTRTVYNNYTNYKSSIAVPSSNDWHSFYLSNFNFTVDGYYMWRCWVRCNSCTSGITLNMRAARCSNDWVTSAVTICSPALADGKWHEYYLIKQIPSSFDRSGTTVTSSPRWEFYTSNLASATTDPIVIDFDIKNIEVIPTTKYKNYQAFLEDSDKYNILSVRNEQFITNDFIEI